MRYILLDYLKLFSILIMIIYHYFFIDSFVFNAPMYSFNDSLLEFIRILFITISGFLLALSYSKQKIESYFLKRISVLAVSSFLISLVTFIFFSDVFIYFGIIHLILFGNVFIYIFKFKPFYLLLFPLFLYIFPEVVHLKLIKKATLDYFPLFPYLIYFLASFVSFPYLSKVIPQKKPDLVSTVVKHSLLIYLIHPVVIFIYLQMYYR